VVALELPLCVVSLGKFVLPIFMIVSSSRFDLCDHLSEERVERDPALYELLNEDVGFLVNPNLGIKNLVSLVPFVFTCFTIVIYLLVETSLSSIFVA
jgi:hypothetical protein